MTDCDVFGTKDQYVMNEFNWISEDNNYSHRKRAIEVAKESHDKVAEKKSIPVRVDSKTVVFMSEARYLKLKNQGLINEKGIFKTQRTMVYTDYVDSNVR